MTNTESIDKYRIVARHILAMCHRANCGVNRIEFITLTSVPYLLPFVQAELGYTTLSPVSTVMGNHLWADILPSVCNQARSTQHCIPAGSLNQVPALIGWGKDGIVTSAG